MVKKSFKDIEMFRDQSKSGVCQVEKVLIKLRNEKLKGIFKILVKELKMFHEISFYLNTSLL